MRVVLRYFPRHLADHLLTRGIAMLLVGTVLLLPVLLGVAAAAFGSVAPRVLVVRSLDNTTLFLTLIATYGVVGRDLRQGFYRLLLAKPLSPIAYYAASFAVALATFLIVLLALSAMFAVVRGPVWPGFSHFADWTVEFVLLGSLVFVFSRFTRLDWLLAILVVVLGGVARERWPAEDSIVGVGLSVVFPPHGDYFNAGAPVWSQLAWALGYAAVMLALGLLTVRYLPPGEHA